MLSSCKSYSLYSNLQDKELVALIINDGNEEAAIFLIYNRYEKDLRYYVYRYFGSTEYLDDLTDELFARIKGKHSDWKPLIDFQWRCSFRTWFCSIASHLFLEKRKELIEFRDKSDSIEKKSHAELTMTECDNAKMVMILEAINRLGNVDYSFILIKELEGYSPVEIAKMLTEKKRKEGRLKVRGKDNTIIIPTVDYVYMIKQRAIKEVKTIVEQIKREWYGNK